MAKWKCGILKDQMPAESVISAASVSSGYILWVKFARFLNNNDIQTLFKVMFPDLEHVNAFISYLFVFKSLQSL